MKKKSNSSEPVTKSDLKKELTTFEGRLNKKFDKRFGDVNRKFDKRFDIAERSLREEIRISFQEAEERLGEKLSQATDKILTRIDPVLKEVTASRDERVIVAHQISELRDRVDDHDEQIRQLKQR